VPTPEKEGDNEAEKFKEIAVAGLKKAMDALNEAGVKLPYKVLPDDINVAWNEITDKIHKLRSKLTEGEKE